MKICTQCKIAKLLTEYHKNRARPSGLRADCKTCVTARATEWNKNNPERHLFRAVEWNQKNKQRVVENERARRLKNPKRKYWANPEKSRGDSRAWKLRNPDKVKAKEVAWRQRNKSLVALYASTRRARKLRATAKWANQSAIAEIFAMAAQKKKDTGEAWHVDHIVPLHSSFVCGLHVEHNLQIITGSENDSKGNRFWPDMP